MTKQEIMDTLLEWTNKLGHTPSHNEFLKVAGLKRKAVRRHFAGYRNLLAVCGLSRSGCGYMVDVGDMLRDWARVARELGKLPSVTEYGLNGRFSQHPLRRRFRSWNGVPYGFKQYAEEQGLMEEWKDVLTMVQTREEQDKEDGVVTSWPEVARPRRAAGPKPKVKQWPDSQKPKKELYGRPLRPFPMLCAPTNEQGVLLLFGAMAEKLGFAILKVQAAYPDCEAFRVVDGELLELLKIEFEMESRNFLLHMHERNGCDMIVCWKHNWPECPLEVVELSKHF